MAQWQPSLEPLPATQLLTSHIAQALSHIHQAESSLMCIPPKTSISLDTLVIPQSHQRCTYIYIYIYVYIYIYIYLSIYVCIVYIQYSWQMLTRTKLHILSRFSAPPFLASYPIPRWITSHHFSRNDRDPNCEISGPSARIRHHSAQSHLRHLTADSTAIPPDLQGARANRTLAKSWGTHVCALWSQTWRWIYGSQPISIPLCHTMLDMFSNKFAHIYQNYQAISLLFNVHLDIPRPSGLLIHVDPLAKRKHDWLVVYLPLWKIWVRQLGWLLPRYGKIKVMFQSPTSVYLCIIYIYIL